MQQERPYVTSNRATESPGSCPRAEDPTERGIEDPRRIPVNAPEMVTPAPRVLLPDRQEADIRPV
jgi:hypothetical protein